MPLISIFTCNVKNPLSDKHQSTDIDRQVCLNVQRVFEGGDEALIEGISGASKLVTGLVPIAAVLCIGNSSFRLCITCNCLWVVGPTFWSTSWAFLRLGHSTHSSMLSVAQLLLALILLQARSSTGQASGTGTIPRHTSEQCEHKCGRCERGMEYNNWTQCMPQCLSGTYNNEEYTTFRTCYFLEPLMGKDPETTVAAVTTAWRRLIVG